MAFVWVDYFGISSFRIGSFYRGASVEVIKEVHETLPGAWSQPNFAGARASVLGMVNPS